MFTVCSKGKGGKEGICWASFLVLRSGSTMPRHDLADFLCAFGQANYRLMGPGTGTPGYLPGQGTLAHRSPPSNTPSCPALSVN